MDDGNELEPTPSNVTPILPRIPQADWQNFSDKSRQWLTKEENQRKQQSGDKKLPGDVVEFPVDEK